MTAARGRALEVIRLHPSGSGATAPSCMNCQRPLGSRVAFCPFCGKPLQVEEAQAVAPSQPAPTARASVPPSLVQASIVQPGPAPSAPVPRPEPVVANAPAAEPVVAAPPAASVPAKARTGRQPRWRVPLIAAIVLGILAIFGREFSPAPAASLLVHVVGPTGTVLSSGQVFVNDRQAGSPDQTLKVSPGALKIRFDLPGWTAPNRSVTVANGSTTRIELIARPLAAKLSLVTRPPSAAATIDGRAYGRTPLNLELPPQTHGVTLTLDGYARKTFDLVLAPGELRNLTVELTPLPPPPAPFSAPAAPPAPGFRTAPFARGVTLDPSPFFSGPSRSSSPLGLIPSGTEVAVIGQVVGEEAWLQLRVNGQPGFTPMNGTVQPWEEWAAAHTGSGALEDVTPGLSAIVGGAAYPLFGVRPLENGSTVRLGSAREASVRFLRGQYVRCVPQTTTRFECTTSGGSDIGSYYLLNGAVLAEDGAPARYWDAQQRAQSGHKGVWADR